jgi:chaperonin cofactor prefoldin
MAKAKTETTQGPESSQAQDDRPQDEVLLEKIRAVTDAQKGSAALKAKVEDLTAQRTALETERATLQERLIDAWGKGNAAVDEAVGAVALNETRRAAIGTVIDRAEADYQRALADDHLAEYEALRDELQALYDRRQTLTAALVKAQGDYDQARYARDAADGNFAGYLSSATSSVDTATMPAEEITVRFGRAADAHEAAKTAVETLYQAGLTLRQTEADYMALCLEVSLKERRAHELGALTNHPYDASLVYRPG